MSVFLFGLVSVLATVDSRIGGTVADQDNNPIAAATVVLVHPDDAAQDRTTTTDDAGWFSLNAPDKDCQILVIKPGFKPAIRRTRERLFQWTLGEDEEALQFQLRPEVPHRVRIVAPDGQPLADTTVFTMSLKADGHSIYRRTGLSSLLSRKTDEQGFVALDVPDRESEVYYVARTQKYGHQAFLWSAPGATSTQSIQLGEVGTLRGSIQCADKEQLAGWKVTLYPLRTDDVDRTTRVFGAQIETSDEEGRFVFEAQTTGTYRVSIVRDATAEYQPERVEPVTIIQGEATEVSVPLSRGRRVFGRVVRRDTGDPVEGVEISAGGIPTRTTGDGTFESFVQQPPTYYSISDSPAGIVLPQHYSRAIELSDQEAKEFDLGTIELQGTTPLTGVVTDAAGAPQPGITVFSAWLQHDDAGRGTFSWASDTARTDNDGQYRLEKTPNSEPLLLSAFGRGSATREHLRIAANADRVVDLTVGPENVAKVSVLVTDAEGRPIQATGRFSQSLETPDRGSLGGRRITFGGTDTIRADESGTISSPQPLPLFGKYSLEISANGFLPKTTDFIRPSGKDAIVSLGAFSLARARQATGIVIGTDNEPLPGVVVSAHGIAANKYSPQPVVSVETDASGQFQLAPLHPHASVVTTHAAGYRPGGAVIRSDSDKLVVMLSRVDESVPDDQRINSPVRSNERVAAGIFLLDSMLPDIRNSNYFNAQALKLLGKVSPDRLPGELAEIRSASARVEALVSLGEYEEASTQVEQINDGYGRGYARFRIIDATDDSEFANQMIAEALLDARTIQRPDRRAVVLAGVAERLTDLGRHTESQALLRDSLEQFQQLPGKDWAGFAKGFFAERLARYDFDAAMAMLDGMEDSDRARHAGNIAHSLAAIEPTKAEELMTVADATRSVVAYRIRVCYRMAGVDKERAEKIRRGYSPNTSNYAKEHSLGVMAMAIRETAPDEARELLQQAWNELEATLSRRSGYTQAGQYRFGVALALLSYAEVIDPENLTDHFWRAVALYPGPQAQSHEPERQMVEDLNRRAMLVLPFAIYRHEPDWCRESMNAAFDYWSDKEHLQTHDFYRKSATFTAMALADPGRAAKWARDAWLAMPKENRRLIPQPWLTVAITLCSDQKAIDNMLGEEVFTRWIIDKYDL